MNIKRIKIRAKINYKEIVEKIITDNSLTTSCFITWLLIELATLQKYILELLIDRTKIQIKILEIKNDSEGDEE